MLAKIPKSMQKDYVDDAKLKPPKQFKPMAAVCIKQFKEAVKQGKMERLLLEMRASGLSETVEGDREGKGHRSAGVYGRGL